MIYIIPLLLLVAGYLNFDRPQKLKKGSGLWAIVYITLVLIIGLRYKVGGDTYNYMTFFQWASELKYWEPINYSSFEPGFSLLTSAIKTITDSIYIYQIIISALMTFMLMMFVRRSTEYKFLAMLLIFVAIYLYFSTEIIRESLAVCGLLVSYPLLRDKHYLAYYLVCLILLSMHSSAIICFILPFFRNLKFDKKFILCIVAMLFLGGFMTTIMERLGQNMIFQKLLRYNTHTYVGYLWCGLRFFYFSLLPMYTIHLCKKRFHIKLMYENMICLQILFGFGIWFVPVVFQRLINYTIIFYLVALAQVIGTVIRDSSYRLSLSTVCLNFRTQSAKLLLVLTLLAHSSYYIHLHFYERYIPYHSAFDPIEEPMREKYVAGQD